MCRRMPQQMAGISARMLNMKPVITQYPNVEVTVDNQMLLNQMNSIRGRIRSTLANDLHNNDLTLTLRLAKSEEVKRVLSKKELFEAIVKKNPAIEKLRGLLDLEFT